jgi:hypothetical protein
MLQFKQATQSTQPTQLYPNPMAELKTKETDADVFAFLADRCVGQRHTDCLTLITLMQEATGEPPKLWGDSIVGFAKYRYQYKTGHSGEWPIIGFSPRKNDLTLYVMPSFDAFPDLLAQLGKHKLGKSCLYLKKLADVDEAILRQILTTAVAQMADQRVYP